ncbi:MAG: CHAT domain-containing protein [Bacteroidia bacterium]
MKTAHRVVWLLCLLFSRICYSQNSDMIVSNGPFDYLERGFFMYPAFPDSAIFYAKKSLSDPENKNASEIIKAVLFLSNLYNYREEFDSVGKYSILAFLKTEEDPNVSEEFKYLAINNLAGYYLLTGKYRDAELLYMNAMEEGPADKDKAGILFNLALVRKKQGDYPGAQETLNSAEALLVSSNKMLRAEIANLKARIFIRLQNWEEAEKYNLLATRQLDSLQDEVSLKKKMELAFGLGLIEINLRKKAQAMLAVKKGKDIQNRLGGYKSEITYGVLSKIYSATGQPDSAEYFAREAVKKITTQYQDLPELPLIAEAWLDLGNVYLKENQWLKGYEAFRNGFIGLLNCVPDSGTIPSVAEVIYPVDAVPLLRGMGKALFAKFESEKQPSDLESAVTCQILATRLISRIYHGFQSETSRLFLAGEAIDAYEEAIVSAMTLAKISPDSVKWKETAFRIAEQNKSAVLYLSLQDAEKINTLGIPDSLLEKELSLKTEYAFFSKKYAEESRKEFMADQKKLIGWQERILRIQLEITNLRKYFKHNYPQYYHIRYEEAEMNAGAVRKLLPADGGWVEFFCGDQHSYAFLITDSRIVATEIAPRDSLVRWVSAFRQVLSSPIPAPYFSDKENKGFSVYGQKLYQHLLAPLESSGEKLPFRLTIVPDDVLGYLPFETFISDTMVEASGIRNLPFLIRSHEIGYAYSAAVQINLQRFSSSFSLPEILIVGPWVDINSPPDQSLVYSQTEIDSISAIFQGLVLTGKNATLSQFVSHAGHFPIIHIATHARVDETDSEGSGIVFSPESGVAFSQNILGFSRIAGLNLNAQLVVLSACETGTGVIQKGEGILSLSRAFTYAGARSMVTTLWQVDDRAPAGVMKDFYRHLSQGHTKTAALRQAKLDYLSRSDNLLAHPFYWGAGVVIGNGGPIISPWRKFIFPLIIALVCLLIVVVVYVFSLSAGSYQRKSRNLPQIFSRDETTDAP